METKLKKYYLRVEDKVVEVSQKIYAAYYEEREYENNQGRKDLYNKLIRYDKYDTGEHLGRDLIADTNMCLEEMVLKSFEKEYIWRCVKALNDKHNICLLTALGYTEQEIAEICGINQSTVSRTKRRLFRKLKEKMKKDL